MVLKQYVKCPSCATVVNCQGKPGEKVILECPKCKDRGFYRFPENKNSKRKRYRKLAMTVVFAVLAVLFLSFVIVPIYQGSMNFLVVLSGSMSPTMKPGDVVISGFVPADEISVGDVITFRDAERQDNFITHRVVEVLDEDDGVHFRTKGDANEDPDLNMVDSSMIVGRVQFVIPYLGYIPSFAKTPLGWFLLIILPGTLVILNEIRIIFNIKRKRSVLT